jgi:DNA transformation protein
MKKDNSYTEYIVYDVLGHIDDITTRPMFSGTGIYLHGVIVAFVTGGELYFKSDDTLKNKYLSLNCHPFTYTKNNKEIEMCYMSADEDIIENREVMSEHIDESYEVSNKDK